LKIILVAWNAPKVGIWAVFHKIRAGYAQLITCFFLLPDEPVKNRLMPFSKIKFIESSALSAAPWSIRLYSLCLLFF